MNPNFTTSVKSLIQRSPAAYRLAMRLGLTRRARQVRAAAAARGERITFERTTTRWEKGNEVVLFPPADADWVNYFAERMEVFRTRLIFRSEGQKQVADLRGPAKYRLPSAGSLWLPTAAEPLDFFTGYFEKGGPQPGQIALDGGAYCGEVALEMAARVGPTGRVYAFEPDPRNLVWLRRNIDESGFKNVVIVPKGLWKETTTLEFFSDENPGSAIASNGVAPAGPHAVTKVEVLSPADAFALIGRVPDFIKMDIEGAEVEVVDAMAPLLTNARTSFAIASYHVRDGKKTHETISGVLERCGFSVSTGYEQHLTTWARRG